MALHQTLRTVSETRNFSTQKEKLKIDAKCLDEVLFGVTWALARKPEIFPVVLKPHKISVIKTDRTKTIPALRIFFSFDENEVKMLWLEEISQD
jgi:hypothetical protein